MRGGAHAAPPSGHYRMSPATASLECVQEGAMLRQEEANYLHLECVADSTDPHSSPPIGRRCGPRFQEGGFTHELPYEGLPGAILNIQNGLQCRHSDCMAPVSKSRVSGRERNNDMHESRNRGNGNRHWRETPTPLWGLPAHPVALPRKLPRRGEEDDIWIDS